MRKGDTPFANCAKALNPPRSDLACRAKLFKLAESDKMWLAVHERLDISHPPPRPSNLTLETSRKSNLLSSDPPPRTQASRVAGGRVLKAAKPSRNTIAKKRSQAASRLAVLAPAPAPPVMAPPPCPPRPAHPLAPFRQVYPAGEALYPAPAYPVMSPAPAFPVENTGYVVDKHVCVVDNAFLPLDDSAFFPADDLDFQVGNDPFFDEGTYPLSDDAWLFAPSLPVTQPPPVMPASQAYPLDNEPYRAAAPPVVQQH